MKNARLLPRAEAAALLTERFHMRCTKQTLANWAHEGRGPAYYVVNKRALYPEAALLDWARGQLGPLYPRPRT